MNAYIITGGDVLLKNIKIDLEEGDLVIAADSGYETAKKLKLPVDVIVGDMDSIKIELPRGIETVKLPAEKDVTDTEAAVEIAIERGAESICIVGGIGTRVDHTMASIGILEGIEGLFSAPLGKRRRFFGLAKQARYARRIYATLTNGYNRVRFIRNDSVIIPRSPYFKYLSLICADEFVKGVTIEGVKYPLKNTTLSRRSQYYTVSNEISGNCAFISVRSGGVYIIESFDDGCEY
jgi:thiamine pyrophosphokinase